MKTINFKGLSYEDVKKMMKEAVEVEGLLKKEEPSPRLAVLCGIVDKSYKTVRYGHVSSYSGYTHIKMADGSVWYAEGHGTKGTAESLHAQGYISFERLHEETCKEELEDLLKRTVEQDYECSYTFTKEFLEKVKKYEPFVDRHLFWAKLERLNPQFLLENSVFFVHYKSFVWTYIVEAIHDGSLKVQPSKLEWAKEKIEGFIEVWIKNESNEWPA